MSDNKSLEDHRDPVADLSLVQLVWHSGEIPLGATREETNAAFARVVARAVDHGRLRQIVASPKDAPVLVSLVRRAAAFVNAVACIADDQVKALDWLVDASKEVGTPDPTYACGASFCDDPACTTHNMRHPFHDE